MALQACDLINPDEDEPAFLKIDSIRLSESFISHGSVSHNITDAWVFVNDEMIGIFELPATIPVLAEGEQSLLIGPGIEVSGLSELRDNYLFYTAYSTPFNFIPGEIQEVEPVVRYREEGNNYIYDVVDDFENIFSGFAPSNQSDTTIIKSEAADEVFEGNASGVINITPDMDFVQIQTASAYELPLAGKVIYMELDYNTEVEFTIGVFINNNGFQDQIIDYITLRKTNGQWKKAYIALTALLSNSVNPENFIFYFRSGLPAGGGVSGKIMLDNVKLMIQR